jgi:hypothetical protein
MSAIQMIIANIEKLNDTDRAQVLGHFSKSAPAKEVGVSKDVKKKKNANKGKPTCYADFAKKVMEEHKDAVAAFKLANPELKGAHLSFVGAYKKDHAEEYAIFKAAWKLAHPKLAVEPSSASDSEPLAEAGEVIMPNEKPKRVMSDEQKAKTKGAAAAAAKKLEGMTPEERAKREAKKAKKASDADSGSEVSVATAISGSAN